MSKKYSFQEQLEKGEMGVIMVKNILHERYDSIVDYRDDIEMQKRGIDLEVEGLGYVEVKADSHKPNNFFFELTSNGKPGAVDRSASDWFCVLFYRHKVMFMVPTPSLHMWLRENYFRYNSGNRQNRVHKTDSYSGQSRWSTVGIVVPINEIVNDIPTIQEITWDRISEVEL